MSMMEDTTIGNGNGPDNASETFPTVDIQITEGTKPRRSLHQSKEQIDRAMSDLADPRLLEKIDQLFACNVGEYVALPQLVVVGDQSSGKSSVLEGLVGFSFPRDKELCTRYATQIIFKRASSLSERRISAAIIPDDSSSDEHKAVLRGWTKQDLGQLDSLSFVKLLKEVRYPMRKRRAFR